MTTTTAAITTTTCSGCATTVRLDPTAGTATVTIPSNGKRGAGHRPAHTATADLWDDGDLLTWECPACDYPDSWDLHQ